MKKVVSLLQAHLDYEDKMAFNLYGDGKGIAGTLLDYMNINYQNGSCYAITIELDPEYTQPEKKGFIPSTNLISLVGEKNYLAFKNVILNFN